MFLFGSLHSGRAYFPDELLKDVFIPPSRKRALMGITRLRRAEEVAGDGERDKSKSDQDQQQNREGEGNHYNFQ